MVITNITKQVKNDKRYNIFIDEEFVFAISDVDVLYYKLKIGDEISADRLNFIQNEAIFTKALNKATSLLGFKARTEKELRQRLLEKEFPDDIVDRVIENLKKYKYIDDESYAMHFANDSIKLKGWGEYKIRYELRLKGISEEIINHALEDSGDREFEKAYALLEKRLKGNTDLDFKEKKKHFDYLARRGYSYDIIKEAFAQLANANFDEEY